jgi:hypothetical protein
MDIREGESLRAFPYSVSAGLLQPWNAKPTQKGAGFVQHFDPHDLWHVDFSYVNVAGTFLARTFPVASRYSVPEVSLPLFGLSLAR